MVPAAIPGMRSESRATQREVGLPFRDRREAGVSLAKHLLAYRGSEDVVVLALPRGGVPVALEVARALGAPLDVFVVRKLGVPGHSELAMGAVASGGTRVLNPEVIDALAIAPEAIESVALRAETELARREAVYRCGQRPVEDAGKIVILVDDGLATGSTMRAALWSLRRARPKKVVVAVPIGSAQSCASIDAEVDELVCLHSEEPLQSIGPYYRDFSEVSDEQVTALLREYRQPPSAMAAFLHVQRRR